MLHKNAAHSSNSGETVAKQNQTNGPQLEEQQSRAHLLAQHNKRLHKILLPIAQTNLQTGTMKQSNCLDKETPKATSKHRIHTRTKIKIQTQNTNKCTNPKQHTLTHSLSLSHSLTLSRSHALTLSRSHALTLSHTHTLLLFLTFDKGYVVASVSKPESTNDLKDCEEPRFKAQHVSAPLSHTKPETSFKPHLRRQDSRERTKTARAMPTEKFTCPPVNIGTHGNTARSQHPATLASLLNHR